MNQSKMDLYSLLLLSELADHCKKKNCNNNKILNLNMLDLKTS